MKSSTQPSELHGSRHRCVYCLEAKSHRDFDKEHVLPDGFGQLRGALTLHRHEVCKECNAYFSRELDRILLRDTALGLMRFISGTKHSSEYKHEGRRSRLTSRYLDGPRPGVLVHAASSDDGLGLTEVPQIVFVDGAGQLYAFSLDELPAPSQLPPGCDLTRAQIRGTSDVAKARAAFARAGYELVSNEPPRTEAPIGPVQVRTEWNVDETDRRALMKIAFNYLTFVAGKGAALHQAFNPTRRFVRWGEPLGYDFVAVLPCTLTSQTTCLLAVGMDAERCPAVRLEFFGVIDLVLRMTTTTNEPPIGFSAHLYDLEKRMVRPAFPPKTWT